MTDLRANLTQTHTGTRGLHTEPRLPLFLRLARAARSAVFVLVLLAYLTFFTGLGQRIIVVPFTWLFPVRAVRLHGAWARLQGRNLLRLLRVFAGVRITTEGSIGPESCIVIMNHQSMVDIAIGFSIVPGHLALIPTRRRYAWGIPGVSVFVRLARLPLISQKRKNIRADLAMLAEAVERTRRGETSFFIFPEGHRTKDGSILPFMTRGLRLALTRIKRPVYCVVGDGMWKVRTLAEMMARVAGTDIRVRVIGPFDPPQQEADIPEFIQTIRERMTAALEDMRTNAR